MSIPLRARALGMAVPAFLVCLYAGFVTPGTAAKSDRIFDRTPGFLLAEDLPDNFRTRVDSLVFDVRDAMEGVPAHSEAEEYLYDLANKLHIDTRVSTLRKRLLFAEGDTVTRELLLESERVLRKEEYLADALIEVKPLGENGALLIVNTFDQWSTTVPLSLNVVGGLKWTVGLVESNLLGTGQRLGFFYQSLPDYSQAFATFRNFSLSPLNLQLELVASARSDGHDYQASLSKPLRSKREIHGWSLYGRALESSEYYYLDGNLVDKVQDSLVDSGDRNQVFVFDNVVEQTLSASYTRSYGRDLKLNAGLFGEWFDKWSEGPVRRRLSDVPVDPAAGQVYQRTNALLGVELSLYQTSYRTVRNFQNLKWNEDLSVGWRLTNRMGRNLEALGATDGDLYLSHQFRTNWVLGMNHYFVGNVEASYWWKPQSQELEDGRTGFWLEYQWKPVTYTSTLFGSRWDHLFNAHPTSQLLLGEEELQGGFTGYPVSFFAGDARVLFEAEQRYFLPFEWATLVPVMATFVKAGNTYPHYGDFTLRDMHYSAGFGMRFGLSKSVQKLVNHWDFSWPIFEDNPDLGFRFTLQSKLAL